MQSTLKKYLYIILMFSVIVILFQGAFLTHLKLHKMAPPHQSMEVYMYVPSGDFIKTFSLGFDQLLADYFWIKTIGYFGEHFMADRNYPWLYHMLELITTLDPQFIWPYYFGGIILSLEANQVEQSNEILKKAMRTHPDVWKFPFFLGFNYWYHYNDALQAAGYIEIATKLPGAPKYLKTLPARLYTEAGQKDVALQFLQEMLKNTQEPRMRKQIKKRIKNLLQGKLKAPSKPKIKPR